MVNRAGPGWREPRTTCSATTVSKERPRTTSSTAGGRILSKHSGFRAGDEKVLEEEVKRTLAGERERDENGTACQSPASLPDGPEAVVLNHGPVTG